jgi:4-carboxymuconolactone decarboxylase
MSGRQHAKNGGDQMTENPDFGTFGRYRETPADKLAPEMKAAYDVPSDAVGLDQG